MHLNKATAEKTFFASLFTANTAKSDYSIDVHRICVFIPIPVYE